MRVDVPSGPKGATALLIRRLFHADSATPVRDNVFVTLLLDEPDRVGSLPALRPLRALRVKTGSSPDQRRPTKNPPQAEA